VAQLRVLAELRSLTKAKSGAVPAVNLFITDTLGNPFVEEEQLPHIVEAVAKSRRDANRVKRGQPITVVIGNPPYKEKAEGRGGWIESGAGGKLAAPLDRWKAPPEWSAGAHGKHLKNLYVYFWRWATLKVFGSGLRSATGLPDRDEEGIVCFITVAGFLNGPGFQKMRDDLRRTCSAIWVIDCSPEGHQPDVPTRIFQGVQQPVCIVLAARKLGEDIQAPASVRFRALPEGRREAKFVALAELSLNDAQWVDCPTDWRGPFLAKARDLWGSFMPLRSLFAYSGSGVMPGRTWIIAPDAETLERRWNRLISETSPVLREELFHPHQTGDKTSTKSAKLGLRGHEHRAHSVANDRGKAIAPVRYAFRSFDRQWIIPDNRLINRANPTLWNAHSQRQIYLTALQEVSPRSGPGISSAAHVPDLHHYKGSFGGRAYPLWADAKANASNISGNLLDLLTEVYGTSVSPADALAYIAAVMAHPAFIAHFANDLKRPGPRLPLTADAALFTEAAALGREVVWLHCYGERYVDPAVGRPRGPPRMAANAGPRIPAAGAIPPSPAPLPDTMTYEAEKRRLHIGGGYIDNVSPAMWNYEVSGKQVLWHWFSYRRRDRTKPLIGDKRPPSPLEKIQPDGWPHEYTSDLIDLLHVLGRLVALEPAQADLLERICGRPLIGADRLQAAGVVAESETGDAGEED
jgi:predicted helicase